MFISSHKNSIDHTSIMKGGDIDIDIESRQLDILNPDQNRKFKQLAQLEPDKSIKHRSDEMLNINEIPLLMLFDLKDNNIRFIPGKINMLYNQLYDKIKYEYNIIKNQHNNHLYNGRFKIVTKVIEYIQTEETIKTGVIVDTLLNNKSCTYNISNQVNSKMVSDFCQTLNLVSQN